MTRSARLVPVLVLAVSALAVACGSGGSDVDPAPFEAALEAYLEKNRSEVTIESVEDVEVSGDTATAKVKVSLEEATGVQPTKTAHYEKEGDGWVVTRFE